MALPRSTTLTALADELRATNTYVADTALALAVAVPLSVPFLTPVPGITVLGGLLNLGTVVPLIWRRRAPFTVAVIVTTFSALVSLHHHPGQMLQYAGLVVFYTIAERGRPWQRHAFLAILIFTFPPAAILLKNNTLAELMFTVLLPLAAFILGALTRTNRERAQALADRATELELRREADTARALAEERTRIARDMHDVLAHAVSVMVVQAEAGPVVVRSDPDRADRTFEIIAEAGRSAMLQLSSTLAVLKAGPDGNATTDARLPQPDVAAITTLVEQVRRAGLRVDLRVDGTPRPLRPDTEVAAYRIVQEALTNTMKHGGGAATEVRLDWDNHLRITVTDAGPTRPTASPDSQGPGQGLIGIRERAAACGGSADAGPTMTGFRVFAELPALAPPPIPGRRGALDRLSTGETR